MSGDGGLRIQFDVPESDEAEALRLLLWREKVLIVTVGPEGDCFTEVNSGLGKRAKRQSQWQTAEIEGADGPAGKSG